MNITNKTKLELLNILKMKKLFGIGHISTIDFNEIGTLSKYLPLDLNNLKEHVSNCSLCELSKSKHSYSLHKGNEKSKIILIDLINGFEEGKELNSLKNILESTLSININDIYMTNVIKCNVSKFRGDLDTQIKQCIPYLEQQINILNPELIITLGSVFNYLMENNDNITDVSGNIFKYNNIKVIPLLEMSFIDKNPSYKEKMLIDLQKIKMIMDEK